MRRSAIRIIPIAIAAVVILFQFMSAEKDTNEAGRDARYGLSKQQEASLGLQSYQQVLSQARIVESGDAAQLVKRVAARLAAATGEKGKKFEWQVALVDGPEINAFCLPGGKIAVYTGILPVAASEAGLATVMGHEMAHATLRHGSERLFKQKTTQTFLTGVSFSLGDMSYEQRRAIMGAIGAGAQYGYILPFSRDHESEADQVGLIYMAKAGYNPEEAIGFWERMSKASQGQRAPPEFMSTHPAHGTRIQRLREMIPEAKKHYQPQLESGRGPGLSRDPQPLLERER